MDNTAQQKLILLNSRISALTAQNNNEIACSYLGIGAFIDALVADENISEAEAKSMLELELRRIEEQAHIERAKITLNKKNTQNKISKMKLFKQFFVPRANADAEIYREQTVEQKLNTVGDISEEHAMIIIDEHNAEMRYKAARAKDALCEPSLLHKILHVIVYLPVKICRAAWTFVSN